MATSMGRVATQTSCSAGSATLCQVRPRPPYAVRSCGYGQGTLSVFLSVSVPFPDPYLVRITGRDPTQACQGYVRKGLALGRLQQWSLTLQEGTSARTLQRRRLSEVRSCGRLVPVCASGQTAADFLREQADPVVIAGGGPAGLSVALSLQRLDIPCKVYESAPALIQEGVCLLLARNGLTALKNISPEAFDEVIRGANVPPGGEIGKEGIPGIAFTVMGRLQSALARALEKTNATFQLGTKVTAIEQVQGRPSLTLTSARAGSSPQCASLLVGADGRHSVVAQALLGEKYVTPEWTGRIVFYGLVSKDLVSPDQYGMKVGPEMPFVTTVRDAGSGRVYWAVAFLARGTDREGYRELADADAIKSAVLDLVESSPADPAGVAKLIRSTGSVTMASIVERAPLESWVGMGGHALVLGDAAYVLSPSSGQGANQSLEDADQLGRCLREGRTLEDALRLFESRRIQRVSTLFHLNSLMGSSSYNNVELFRKTAAEIMELVNSYA